MAQSATTIPGAPPAARPANPSGPANKTAEQSRLEQQKLDYVAWLREYHRWSEKGCCIQKLRGEIEWGFEDDST